MELAAKGMKMCRVAAVLALAAILPMIIFTVPSSAAESAKSSCATTGKRSTSVDGFSFDRSRRPVIYVHGWNGGVNTWTSNSSYLGITPYDGEADTTKALQERTKVDGKYTIDTFLFDYQSRATRWASDPDIAACLADYINRVGSAWQSATGADGKVIVVAHSMGGMAALYSTSVDFTTTPSTDHLKSVITFDTPFLGSTFGGKNGGQVGNLLGSQLQSQARGNDLVPTKGDALYCLAPHRKGNRIPSPCEKPLPPPLPSAVGLTTITGNITMNRKALFNLLSYQMPLSSDGVVPIDSQWGYLDIFKDVPLSDAGVSTTENVVDCTVDVTKMEALAQQLIPGGWLTRMITSSLGVFNDLATYWEMSKEPNQNRVIDASQYNNQAATSLVANMLAPCSHANMPHNPAALDMAAKAVLKSNSSFADKYKNQFGSYDFVSPSGNVACNVGGRSADLSDPYNYSVVCIAKEHSWTGDTRPDTSICPEAQSWIKGAVAIFQSGVVAGVCGGDDPTYSARKSNQVLPYGAKLEMGNVTCSSAENGISCSDARFNAGFRVSMDSVDLNGTRPQWVSASSGAGSASPFVGSWGRHTSGLDINPDMTGKAFYGSGCCNSISVPLSFAPGEGGTLTGTVTGEATYTGDSFNDTKLPVGTEIKYRLGQSEGPDSGTVLLEENHLGGEGDIVWCKDGGAYDLRCGA